MGTLSPWGNRTYVCTWETRAVYFCPTTMCTMSILTWRLSHHSIVLTYGVWVPTAACGTLVCAHHRWECWRRGEERGAVGFCRLQVVSTLCMIQTLLLLLLFGAAVHVFGWFTSGGKVLIYFRLGSVASMNPTKKRNARAQQTPPPHWIRQVQPYNCRVCRTKKAGL